MKFDLVRPLARGFYLGLLLGLCLGLIAACGAPVPSENAAEAENVATPERVNPVPHTDRIAFSWDPVPAADSYNVYAATNKDILEAHPDFFLANVETPYFVHSELEEGLTFHYLITSVRGVVESPATSIYTVTTLLPDPFPVPRNVQAIAGDGEVFLWWEPIADATGYQVRGAQLTGEQALSLGAAPAVTLPARQNAYIHKGLVNGEQHAYSISALYAEGVSASSRLCCVIPEEAQPIRQRWAEEVDGFVNLTVEWSSPEDMHADSQILLWSTEPGVDPGTYQGEITLSIKDERATHLGVSPEVNYYYAVYAKLDDMYFKVAGETNLYNTLKIPAPTDKIGYSTVEGVTTLTWNESVIASGYYVYARKTEPIYSLIGLLPVATLSGRDNTSWTHLSATRNQAYHYAVVAFTLGGESQPTTLSTIALYPPKSLRGVQKEQTVELEWMSGTPSSAPTTRYKVYRSEESIHTIVGLFPVADTTKTLWVDTAAEYGKVYHYAVAAYHGGNTSTFATYTVGVYAPPETPSELVLEDDQDARSVTLRWVGSPNALGYHIFKSTTAPITSLDSIPLYDTVRGEPSWSEGNLDYGAHFYAVRAYNDSFLSDSFATASTELVQAPGSFVMFTPYLDANTREVNLSWNFPYWGGVTTGFRVYWGPEGEEPQVEEVGLQTAWSQDGIVPGVNYHVAVHAYNAAGEGPASQALFSLPYVERVGLVPFGKHTVHHDQQIVTLRWNYPATGGRPLGYRFYLSDAPIDAENVDALTPILIGVDFHSYNFKYEDYVGKRVHMAIHGYNENSEAGELSQDSIYLWGAPEEPRISGGVADKKAGTIQISWPHNAAGGPVAGYRVYYSLKKNPLTEDPVDVGYAASFVTPSIPAGIYHFALIAYNLAGESTPAAGEYTLEPIDLPQAVSNLRGIGVRPGFMRWRGILDVAWNEPLEGEYSPIEGYNLYLTYEHPVADDLSNVLERYRYQIPKSDDANPDLAGFQWALPDVLTEEGVYHFAVSAYNLAGEGHRDHALWTVNGLKPGSVWGASSEFERADDKRSAAVTLRWKEPIPEANTLELKGYYLSFWGYLPGKNVEAPLRLDAEQITLLPGEKSYSFTWRGASALAWRVVPFNAAGTSYAEAEVLTMEMDELKPGRVPFLNTSWSATTTYDGDPRITAEVELRWQVPAGDTSPAKGYRLYSLGCLEDASWKKLTTIKDPETTEYSYTTGPTSIPTFYSKKPCEYKIVAYNNTGESEETLAAVNSPKPPTDFVAYIDDDGRPFFEWKAPAGGPGVDWYYLFTSCIPDDPHEQVAFALTWEDGMIYFVRGTETSVHLEGRSLVRDCEYWIQAVNLVGASLKTYAQGQAPQYPNAVRNFRALVTLDGVDFKWDKPAGGIEPTGYVIFDSCIDDEWDTDIEETVAGYAHGSDATSYSAVNTPAKYFGLCRYHIVAVKDTTLQLPDTHPDLIEVAGTSVFSEFPPGAVYQKVSTLGVAKDRPQPALGMRVFIDEKITKVEWQERSDSAIDYFDIFYRCDASASWEVLASGVDAGVDSFRMLTDLRLVGYIGLTGWIGGLHLWSALADEVGLPTHHTGCKYSIVGKNELGWSGPRPAQVHGPKTAPEKVSNFRAFVEPDHVAFEWSPSTSSGAADSYSFRYECGLTDPQGSQGWVLIDDAVQGFASSHKVAGDFEQCKFSIEAHNNLGNSGWVIAQGEPSRVPQNVPDPIPALQVYVDLQGIHLEWKPPQSGTQVDGYRVYYGCGDWAKILDLASPSSTSHRLNGLFAPDCEYAIAAYNVAGESEWKVAHGEAPKLTPGKVSSFQAELTEEGVSFSWERAKSGGPVRYYDFFHECGESGWEGIGSQGNGDATSVTFAGSFEPCNFAITAVNGAGQSGWVIAAVSSAEQASAFRVVVAEEGVSFFWAKPEADVAVESYAFYYECGGSGDTWTHIGDVTNPDATHFFIAGSFALCNFSIQVVGGPDARWVMGAGEPVAEGEGPPALPPGKASSFGAILSEEGVSFSWEKAKSGGPVNFYDFFYQCGENGWEGMGHQLDGDATSATFAGSFVPCNFAINAVNDIGQSGWALTTVSSTEQVSAFTVTISETGASFSWAKPEADVAVESYAFYYECGGASGKTWTHIGDEPNPEATSAFIAGDFVSCNYGIKMVGGPEERWVITAVP